MKSLLRFLKFETHAPSDCGDVLDIEFSSRQLDWPGVILEKGSSPFFYPKNVYTPYFYFALGLEQDLHWSVKIAQGMTELKTPPGDIWINPPRSPFSHKIDEACYFLILAIEEETFLKSCSFDISGKSLQFLNNYNVHDETIKGIMELFFIEAKNGGRNGSKYVHNMLSLLSTHYIQSYSNYTDLQINRSSAPKFDKAQLDKVNTYIEENIGKLISIEDLADLLHCSKYYFLRVFKQHVGVTPYQHIMKSRLDKAQERLSSPNSSIAAIGLELGFNDQSHFTRSFKNQFGVTPGQYQKRSHYNHSKNVQNPKQ